MLRALSVSLSNLTGWRRAAVLFVGGVMATLTLPPLFALPLLIPAFSLLYLLVDRASSARRAFRDGWWWGMGWHVSGLYWFCIALLTEPEKFGWLIPFCLIGLNGIIAIYAGIACWLWKKTGCRGAAGVFVFSVVWTLVEFARGYLFTGFPWNLAGYAFTGFDAPLQLASLVGAYGLTWLAVFLGVVPVLLCDDASPRKRVLSLVAASYVCFAAACGWGAMRLAVAGETQLVPDVMLRLVQANIQQHHKWDERLRLHGVEAQVWLTQSPGIERVTHVIWPETAVPYALKDGIPLTHMLGAALPPNVFLITGGLSVDGDASDWHMFNSILMLDHTGGIVGRYDKVKLVPFGEFLPLRPLLPASWLMPVGEKDFSRGDGAKTVHWPGLPPVTPLICYEGIFPAFVAAAHPHPDWILNLTNDAWFGRSSGPYQHFEMVRTRAVEQGVPVVRVANTGISAVMDGYGRIVAEAGLEKQAVIDSPLPVPNQNITLYQRAGEWYLLALTFFALVLTIGQRRRINN